MWVLQHHLNLTNYPEWAQVQDLSPTGPSCTWHTRQTFLLLSVVATKPLRTVSQFSTNDNTVLSIINNRQQMCLWAMRKPPSPHSVLFLSLDVPSALTALEGFPFRFNCISMPGLLVISRLCIFLIFLEIENEGLEVPELSNHQGGSSGSKPLPCYYGQEQS